MSTDRAIILAATSLALTVAAPRAAHAFSELARFAEPAIDGGGEGRYFTGAPTDGLACSVCHAGGATPDVAIVGLPERLAAGTPYTVSLTWPDDGRAHALALELVDAAGRHPGVTLPAAADQPADMRCTEPAGGVAATTVDVGTRRVIAVAPCGARSVRFSFTPASDEPLYLGAGIVASDGSETADGDGVREVRRTLAAAEAGCSAGGTPALPVALALLGVAWPRRRRARAVRR